MQARSTIVQHKPAVRLFKPESHNGISGRILIDVYLNACTLRRRKRNSLNHWLKRLSQSVRYYTLGICKKSDTYCPKHRGQDLKEQAERHARGSVSA